MKSEIESPCDAGAFLFIKMIIVRLVKKKFVGRMTYRGMIVPVFFKKSRSPLLTRSAYNVII